MIFGLDIIGGPPLGFAHISTVFTWTQVLPESSPWNHVDANIDAWVSTDNNDTIWTGIPAKAATIGGY